MRRLLSTYSSENVRIHLDEPKEVEYWCDALMVSEETLKDAVEQAGPSAVAVQAYLMMNESKSRRRLDLH